MIYLTRKYYLLYKLVDFKEAGFDWLVKFENTFDETIKFIENTNNLEKPRFYKERRVSIDKKIKIDLVLNSDLIDEKIKEKIKFCYNI
jgi:ribosomal RNA small subunit methyltransferase D